jgi:hypothetical protein
LSNRVSLGRVTRSSRVDRRSTILRWLLPVGWVLAAAGYYGPWIAHGTAALTLSGVDMGEFVKFLPGALDGPALSTANGSPAVVRQIFYLPPLAVVIGVALLAGSRRLHFAWPLQALLLILAVPVSLQLLPPAWSPASLTTAEFRLQTIALGACWLLLAGFWLLGQVPPWLAGTLAGALALAAGILSAWQFLLVKPAVDAVYHTPPAVGWGFVVCLAGLAVTVVACVTFVVRARPRSEGPWSSI